MQAPIEDYAAIGDGRSVALIAKNGSIDWLCWPRFDSPSLFGSLLDRQRGGTFRIGPLGEATTSRRYLPGTNVLETTFRTDEGEWSLIDFMPVGDEATRRSELLPDHELVRLVRCHRGVAEFDVEYDPRPGYGSRDPHPIRFGGFGLRIRARPGVLDLAGDVGLDPSGRWSGRLHAGETATFRLTYTVDKPAIAPPLSEAEAALGRTIDWWRDWCGAIPYQGPFRDEVIRSALALKLLIYSPSGGIVAAPTTSLPEWLGAPFNWDYRFCWPRDGALIVRALLGLGFHPEAEAFVSWLIHTTRLTRPRIGVLYDVFGRPGTKERFLDLEGYAGSRPVRIGNAAATQLQLDVYGEVIDAAARYIRDGGVWDRDTAKMLMQFGGFVCEHWKDSDKGIWEPRGEAVVHTHSRVMCWTAIDRLIELHDMGRLPGAPVTHYREIKKRIRNEIERTSWNPDVHAWVESPGSKETDASLLLLPWYGFEQASAPRMQGTWRLIREQLEARPGYFYRYRPGPSRPEGTFGICSFWAVEFLAAGGGTLEEAEEMFELALAAGNDVGLFSEEYHPYAPRALGNFPQGLSHVGLLNAALTLEAARRAARRGEPRSSRLTKHSGRPEWAAPRRRHDAVATGAPPVDQEPGR